MILPKWKHLLLSPKTLTKVCISYLQGFRAVLISNCFCGLENTDKDESDSSSDATSSDVESADGPGELAPFHPPASDEAELEPVVELRYELMEHIKDEDILHPSEFYNEKAQIIRCHRHFISRHGTNSWLHLSIIRAARERSALLPELDTTPFHPPEISRFSANKDIEEYVRNVQARNSKRKRGCLCSRASYIVRFASTDGSFLRCSPQEAPPEARELRSEVVVHPPQTTQLQYADVIVMKRFISCPIFTRSRMCVVAFHRGEGVRCGGKAIITRNK